MMFIARHDSWLFISWLLWHSIIFWFYKMPSGSISDHLVFKIFLGDMPPGSPSINICMHADCILGEQVASSYLQLPSCLRLLRIYISQGGPKLVRADQFWLPKLVQQDQFWQRSDFLLQTTSSHPLHPCPTHPPTPTTCHPWYYSGCEKSCS